MKIVQLAVLLLFLAGLTAGGYYGIGCLRYAYLITTEPPSGDAEVVSMVSEPATDNICTDNISIFRSKGEIRQWVKDSQTYQNRYIIDDYDCDDFMFDLWKEAQAQGKPVGIYCKMVYLDGKLYEFHYKNFAVVGSLDPGKNGYVYEVEPMNGNVKPLAGWAGMRLD